MRTLATALIAVALMGCKPRVNDSPGPSNPGVGNVDSTTYGGDAFVPGPNDLSFIDTATGSRFNLAGQAFEGELAGEKVQLGQLPGVSGFWFAWSTHHPGARVWNRGFTNADETIQGGECGVPCEEIVSACFGGRDCIPSIDRPDWTTADDTGSLGYLVDDDRVLGIARDGLARAYPLDTLWTHEIVNDTWGDWEFSLTYCPLTGSGMIVDGVQGGQDMRFGVSGNLYNSNLVMYDRETNSLYGQLRQVGITGDNLGLGLSTVGVTDTTWGQWREMFPGTEVLTQRFSSGYPYGDYREDNTNIFQENNPAPDPLYPNKSYAIGVIGETETVIWSLVEMEEEQGELAVVEDMLGDLPVLVVMDARTQTAVVYSRLINGEVRTFSR